MRFRLDRSRNLRRPSALLGEMSVSALGAAAIDPSGAGVTLDFESNSMPGYLI